jgi:hypothetical protein
MAQTTGLSLDDAVLAALLDAMLPGDGTFPPASRTAIAPTVRARLTQLGGAETEARIAAAWLAAGGGAVDAVTLLERERPALFDHLRRAAYLAYYEAPGVIAAIRATGVDYRGAPQPGGYDLGAFDPASDAPAHGRGRWKTTAETDGKA